MFVAERGLSMRTLRVLSVVLILAANTWASAQPRDNSQDGEVLRNEKGSNISFPDQFSAPNEFANDEELTKWANPLAFNSVIDVQRLEYKKYRLFVVYRSHTSGVFSAEPIVYIGIKDETETRLIKFANFSASYRVGLNATVDNGFLVIHQVNLKGKATREYGRFNLETLP